MATPAISTRWLTIAPSGRCSTMRRSVLHSALDKTELGDGERDDDRHQDHRLRGGTAQVERLHAILIDLEHQDRGSLHRTAAGRGIDDRERLEKPVHAVDDQQEERGW